MRLPEHVAGTGASVLCLREVGMLDMNSVYELVRALRLHMGVNAVN